MSPYQLHKWLAVGYAGISWVLYWRGNLDKAAFFQLASIASLLWSKP